LAGSEFATKFLNSLKHIRLLSVYARARRRRTNESMTTAPSSTNPVTAKVQ
jgi:hypothetical protein